METCSFANHTLHKQATRFTNRLQARTLHEQTRTLHKQTTDSHASQTGSRASRTGHALKEQTHALYEQRGSIAMHGKTLKRNQRKGTGLCKLVHNPMPFFVYYSLYVYYSQYNDDYKIATMQHYSKRLRWNMLLKHRHLKNQLLSSQAYLQQSSP